MYKRLRALVTLTIAIAMSASAFALSCTESNWDDTNKSEARAIAHLNNGIGAMNEICTYRFQHNTENHKAILQQIETKIDEANQLIKHFQKSKELMESAEKNWLALHNSCDDSENAAMAYAHYEALYDGGEELFYSDSSKQNVVNSCIDDLKKNHSEIKKIYE